MVTLVHGPNEIDEPLLAGYTLGVAIRAFSAQLNLGTTVQAFAQGSVLQLGYVIRENDHIEFVKPFGQKGLDPFTEEAISISQAARRLPGFRGNKHPHPNTVARWATHGQKSRSGRIVYLETMRIGGSTCTSVEALRRFFDQLDDVDVKVPPTYRQAQLDKQAAEAEKILRERGLIK